jgi:hypothetical protein
LALLLRAERGESSIEQIDQLTKGMDRMSDPQIWSGVHFVRSVDAMARDEFETAFNEAIRALELDPPNGDLYAHYAGMAALWLGDVDRARLAAKYLDGLPLGGKKPRAIRIGLSGMVDALEARPAAASHLRDGMRRLVELGLAFPGAQLGVAFAMVAGVDHAEARAAAEEARAVFARVGARPWVERTDAVLSGKIPPILAAEPLPEEAPIA